MPFDGLPREQQHRDYHELLNVLGGTRPDPPLPREGECERWSTTACPTILNVRTREKGLTFGGSEAARLISSSKLASSLASPFVNPVRLPMMRARAGHVASMSTNSLGFLTSLTGRTRLTASANGATYSLILVGLVAALTDALVRGSKRRRVSPLLPKRP
jgi:hypothetical protein